jgi:hypothetical protein
MTTYGILHKNGGYHMRKCYICKIEKELIDFNKDKTQSGGLSYDCKKCKSEKRKQLRFENPEKYREQNRKSKEKNYETIRESQRKHRIENRDKILKRRKELRELRKKEINARESERRKNKRKNDPIFLQNERAKLREYYRINREKMIPQRQAHQLVMYAVKLGMIKKPSECEICKGNIRIEGHHDDYTKPLEVRWLCKSCHYYADRERLNAST